MHFKLHNKKTVATNCGKNGSLCVPQDIVRTTAVAHGENATETAPQVTRGSTAKELRKELKSEQRFITSVENRLKEFPPGSGYADVLEKVVVRAKARTPGWQMDEKQGPHDSQFLNYMVGGRWWTITL